MAAERQRQETVAVNDEVTVAEAAQLLNVSEHYVDEQLATGGLPFRMVGSQRVLRRADVMAYRARMDEQAEAALAALTAEAEDLGLYGS